MLTCLASVDASSERADWAPFFEQLKVEGTIVIYDERPGTEGLMTFNSVRAEKRFSPASTFKIPHTLFALDSEVIRDEFETVRWDGKKRANPEWDRDQDLRSAMRYSVVWVYQQFAKEIGATKERDYLKRIQYGNQDPSGKEPFWISGNLEISAHEQIKFLKRLYRNELPFTVANQRLVKDLMILEAGHDWILRGKAGWDGKVCWWVGWIEHATGPVFFALNIDTPNGTDDIPKREIITKTILNSIGALNLNVEPSAGGNG
ncbi:class D beta-lactamase [Coraliomargarita sinensis]|uniref:Beta-lactamase n=2 Tax=Coraliomargarita sinensis TaxID=2174842 RepID=A0A317ZI63_9BACT|nr:class D beta-lactamase [Coraliomargarita sinensis]PXA03061.1 class D beta-lactamase [Coraliomargarita sinensis]